MMAIILVIISAFIMAIISAVLVPQANKIDALDHIVSLAIQEKRGNDLWLVFKGQTIVILNYYERD